MTDHTETIQEPITIRLAAPGDGPALLRIAQLDSADPPAPAGAGILVADVGGEIRAALALAGGPAIADPFQRTGPLVELLAARAAEIAPAKRPRSRRGRVLGALSPAQARG